MNQIGLVSYLINKNSLEEVVSQTKYENLSLITSGPIPPNPAELLNGERMKELIEKLKDQYDYVIIDTPHVD